MSKKREDGLLDSHSGFEIEDGHLLVDKKTSEKAHEISVSLNHVSLDLGDEKAQDDGYLIGACLMGVTTIIWSVMHIATKWMYAGSPEMNGYDTVSVMAYSIVPCYYIYSKVKGINLYFFDFEPKVQVLLVLRILVGLANNMFLFNGMRFIPIGKTILIWSLSPLFWSITAAIFLKEKITAQSIVLILCSLVGVYLLTLNKPQDQKEASMEIFGYIFVMSSALLYGILFVMLRKLSLYNINIIVSPFYFGCGTLLQNIFIMIFMPNLFHFSSYRGENLIYLGIVMVTWVIGQFTWTASNKYSAASKMAPISYAENILTILADVIIFNYHFVVSDILGMIIIGTCLSIPVIQKIKSNP